MDPRVVPRAAWLVSMIALTLGVASLWQVTEQDIFWQIRAGDELWQGRGFPQVDSWSFTAAGQPWWNVQWLSTLLFSALFFVGGAPGLVIGRGLLIAFLFWRVGLLVLASLSRHSKHVLTVPAALLPLLWTALAFRLELRSDTLVFVVFVEVLLRHARGTLRPWQLPAAVVLAANLHVGTAPFVALLATALAFELRTRWRTRMGVCAGSVAALFVAPYHVRVVGFWWRHLFYAAHTSMQNPDHQPLQPAHHFSVHEFGLYGVTWLGLTVLALVGFWFRWTGEPHARRGFWLPAAGFVVLTALCTNRIRIFPYQLFFLVPHLARSLELAILVLGRYAATGATLVAAFGCFLGVRQATHSSLRYGLSLSRAMYPIGSAAFIQREHVSPNLFHTFAYGAYTVYALRDYLDFVDTRETMFDGLQTTILDAYASPERTQSTMDRFGIQATLVPIPKTERVGELGYRNAITEYLPKSSWALVYFDDISIVVVRRIPEHAALIARHEYQYLYPNLPPGNFLRMKPEGERLARYRDEVTTCLHDEPTNAFCLETRRRLDGYSAPDAR